MTTFNEKFPELTLRIPRPLRPPKELIYSMWTMERLLEDIEKYCISKQKVLEAINKCNKESKDAFQSMIPSMLLKELNLPEEP